MDMLCNWRLFPARDRVSSADSEPLRDMDSSCLYSALCERKRSRDL